MTFDLVKVKLSYLGMHNLVVKLLIKQTNNYEEN